MDFRKLISFGKGGYVISVPKDWVVENKLEKGSLLYVEKQGGSLILNSKEKENEVKEEKRITLEIDGQDDKFVRGSIISSYLKGYDTITIKGNELKNKLPMIKEWVHNLIAFEIIESSKEKLVLKDFLDYNEVSIDKTLKKMDIIIRSMYVDLLEKDKKLYDNIIQRNNEVGRHHHLLLKIFRKVIDNPYMMKKFGLSLDKLLVSWSLNISLRQISEEIVRLVSLLKETKSTESIEKEIFEFIAALNGNYLLTMKAFYIRNFELADKLRNKRTEMNNLCCDRQKKYWDKRNIPSLFEILRNINYSNHSIVRRLYGI